MALLIFGFTYLLALAIHAGVAAVARSGRAKSFRAVSPGMLPPLGILFGLFVAFTAAQTSLITQDALPILGDRIQLQQVILNLVMNGIDAMRDRPSENRIVSIRTSRVDSFAQLSVLDRGPGIPEDKLKEIFEPFFTSKAEGMGMGLSIARTIVEAHHGLISAKNRDHGGATFRIRLPISNDRAMPS